MKKRLTPRPRFFLKTKAKAKAKTFGFKANTKLYVFQNYTVHRLQMPSFKLFELLAVHIQSSSLNLIVGVIYRSGFSEVNFTFFDVFADFIERVAAVYAAPLIIVGDVNDHLDVLSASSTSNFNDILAGAGLV